MEQHELEDRICELVQQAVDGGLDPDEAISALEAQLYAFRDQFSD